MISYIERGEIRPLLAKTLPLSQIAVAQEEFMEKKHFGNFVLVPPGVDGRSSRRVSQTRITAGTE